MLDSPRTMIMCKDLQLKLNIDTGEGRNVKAGQNLAIFPRVLAKVVDVLALQCCEKLYCHVIMLSENICYQL